MSRVRVRPATVDDTESVVSLLYELAVYEKLTDKFRLTREVVVRDFFGPHAACQCDLAFLDATPIGVMTWYRVYGSFAASRGIHLEDIFVQQVHRGKGAGLALLSHLAARAHAEGAAFINWFVLDWNKPSIDFYESLGAQHVKGWLSYRLSGDALQNLAKS